MAKRDVIKIHGSGAMNWRIVERERIDARFVVSVMAANEEILREIVCDTLEDSQATMVEVAHEELAHVLAQFVPARQ